MKGSCKDCESLIVPLGRGGNHRCKWDLHKVELSDTCVQYKDVFIAPERPAKENKRRKR